MRTEESFAIREMHSTRVPREVEALDVSDTSGVLQLQTSPQLPRVLGWPAGMLILPPMITMSFPPTSTPPV